MHFNNNFNKSLLIRLKCISEIKILHDLLGFENLSTLLLTALLSLLFRVLLLLELSSVSSDVIRTSSSLMSTIEFPLERNMLSGSIFMNKKSLTTEIFLYPTDTSHKWGAKGTIQHPLYG